MMKRVLAALVLAAALAGSIAAQPEVRRPRGVYAECCLGYASGSQGLIDSDLANPAVSGLQIGDLWMVLNPNSPSSPQAYNWGFVDEAFSSVAAWNAQHPTQPPKTIMISIAPGFSTPQWVLDQIPSCDGLFMSPPQTPPSDCGKVSWVNAIAGETNTGYLPMPWNPVYKSAFRTFLMAFATRYGSNPAFVSIDLAGPTAASTEMILPNSGNTPPQTQFGGSIMPDDMWRKLLAFFYPSQPSHQNSDQAFIDEWEAAIDIYGQVFSGVTLISVSGAQLPNLNNTGFTVPEGLKTLCGTPPTMDCAAELTVQAYLADPTVGGNNAKSIQTDGLIARIPFPKLLSQDTAQLQSPSAQVQDGQQFGSPVSVIPVQMGCTASLPFTLFGAPPPGCTIPSTCTEVACLPVTCIPQGCLAPGVTYADLASYQQYSDVPAKYVTSPEQATYNVLRTFFANTPAAASFGRVPDTGPENYLQIYTQDFAYAANHVSSPAPVVETDGTTVPMTVQDLLNLASQKLLQTAQISPTLASPAAGNGPSQTFAFTFTDLGGYQNLSVVDVLINSALDGRQACYVAFVPTSATSGSVFLVDDGGDAGGPYQGLVLPGGGTVSNSQCTISGAGSSVSGSGNNLALTLEITFTAGFWGNKVFYLSSQGTLGNSSGWQALGTWGVPGTLPSGPGGGGVTPARSNSVTHAYTFTFTDTNGWQDIEVANILINNAIDGRHACFLAFVPSTATSGALDLVDDAGDAGGPYSGMVIPGSGSVSNSQCAINGSPSSVMGSGNTLTLTFTITFNDDFAGFAGNKVIYMATRGKTASSGWQAAGSVSVP